MKTVFKLLAAICLFSAVDLGAAVHVRGYTRKDASQVAPQDRTAPNRAKPANTVNAPPLRHTTRPVAFSDSPPGGHAITSGLNAQDFAPRANSTSAPAPTASYYPAKWQARAVSPPAIPAPSRATNSYQLIESTSVFYERAPLLEYQRERAAKGDPEAQYAMAMRYQNGIDVPKDQAKTLEYLLAADRNGNLRARAKLSERNAAKRKAAEARAIAADEQFLRERESLATASK